MKKLEMLISDGLNVNGSFQLFPHGGKEMGGAYLTWLNFTLAALQDFSIYKSFHSKVIFRCWAAFRLGHHVNKEVAPSLLLIYFYEKCGGTQVFAHQAGGLRRRRREVSAAHMHTLACTHPGTCSIYHPPRLDQRADLLCLHARDAAAAGGAGSPHRVSLSCRLHNSLHWGPGSLACAKNTPQGLNTTE